MTEAVSTLGRPPPSVDGWPGLSRPSTHTTALSATTQALPFPGAAMRMVSQARAVTNPVVIAAGGTGGHLFPAEALAAELIRRGHRIVLMTDARSGGLRSTVFAEQEHHVLRGAGIAGRGLLRATKAVFALLAGVAQARGLLSRLQPAAIVGFGGYPTIAPALAARMPGHRPPVILHEQNGVLGRANRFLAHGADTLALSLERTARVPDGVRRVVTGNPVRPAIMALAETGYAAPNPDGPIRLLILGGSLGARVFSDVVPEALRALPVEVRARLSVTQQCRQEDLERVRGAYAQAGIRADLDTFFADVAERLRAAHLVIARAGASTVAELAVAGRPAILVPLPGAIDDHQTANAAALAAAGGAWVVPQLGFTPADLAARVTALCADPATLARAAAAAAGQGRADAAAQLADLVEARMRQETRS